VATIVKAVSLARDGFPDHILFKRGDIWYSVYGLGGFKSGRSATQPLVIGYYGESGPRPKFYISGAFINSFATERSHLVFLGLEWYAYKHDPNSPDFSSTAKVNVFRMNGYGENILIEDCVAIYASLGGFSPVALDVFYKNIKLRRVIACNAYAPDSYNIHELYTRVQGIYINQSEGVLIEDCLFDHNGWNEKVEGSGPNMFNHNVYMSGNNPDPSKIIIRNNVFSRASAHGVQLRSGGSATGNLFIQNSININIGYPYIEYNYDHMLQWVADINTTTVSNNVIMETKLMDSTNSDYPRTSAIWGIAPIYIPCRINNNILAHSLQKGGVAIDTYTDINFIGGGIEKEGNIIYKYYTSSTNETVDPGWLDPDREIGHYHQSLGKKATTEAFLMEARKRPLKTLWPDYSAQAVNNYIKNGFSITEDVTPPQSPETVLSGIITDASAEIFWTWSLDNERTLGYNIYVEGIKINSLLITDTTYTIFQLNAESNYTVTVKAVDIAGNESDGTDVQFTTLFPDISPPETPKGLEIKEVTDSSFIFLWEASSDDRMIWGYRIYLDNVMLIEDIIEDTSYTISQLNMGITYSVKVSALDPAWNESPQSEELFVRVPDSQAPSNPGNVFISDITEGSVMLNWEISTDNVGVTGYNIYMNSMKIGTTTELEYEVNNLISGDKIRLSVAAIDLDGNESRWSSYQFIVGISEDSYSILKIYPNPVEDAMEIHSVYEINAIEIVSITGSSQIIRSHLSGFKHKVDVNELTKGIYLIKINTSESIAVRRFIKN